MTESEICLHIEALLAQCKEHQWRWALLEVHGALSVYALQVQRLCHAATLVSVPTLVLIAQQGTQYRQQTQMENKHRSSGVLHSLDAAALDAARALLRLANTEPSRAFLPVLEALQQQAQSFHAPLEFIPIRLRLTRVLRRLNNLPIPASAPQTTDSLPIPVEEAEAP